MLGLTILLGAAATAQVSTLNEGFDNITTLPSAGWFTQNNSVPVGTTGWFQGNSAVFPAQSGAATSYIGANFNNTTGANTISNWLVTPQLALVNGAQFSFWTRTITSNPFPDRLQVRLSTNGASTNVGTGNAGVGDFTTLLIDINPTYTVGNGPVPTNYPETWTQVTLTLSGLPAGGANGRIAFRYFVEDGGPSGDNSNYIGIDTVSYTAAVPVAANGQCDYNGDGKTDYVVVRNVGGGANGQVRWFYNLSSGGNTVAKDWGLAQDEFICGNWDTDNNDDIAIWRPGAATVAAFYILRSTDFTALIERFGQTNDDPSVVADYTGDGRTDFAVYRAGATGAQSTWFYRSAATPGGAVTYVNWGQGGDFPCSPGDYAGNANADFCVQRAASGAGQFWILSSAGSTVTTFGRSTDFVVQGDYDADGKTDIAVSRTNSGVVEWYWLPSSGGPAQQRNFGATGDVRVPGDYTGDGRWDIAVWRSGTFWVSDNATGAVVTNQLGATGDYPVANFSVH
jgi:hypothetical protein